jgi:hypothetical protein
MASRKKTRKDIEMNEKQLKERIEELRLEIEMNNQRIFFAKNAIDVKEKELRDADFEMLRIQLNKLTVPSVGMVSNE